MSANTTARKVRPRTVKYDLRPLAVIHAIRGGLAMVITSGANAGFYTNANTTDVGVVVGMFAEDVDNSAGSNGALKANVEFFKERTLEGLLNDTGTPVTNAMKELSAYLLDNQTVTGAINGAPVGVVYEVSADGNTVWVEGRQDAVEGSQAPAIQSGTTTLVAGTKTIAANVTANSRILLSRKAAGGTTTTTVGYETGARTPGQPGSFVIDAVTSADGINTSDTSQIDWMVIG